MSRIRALLSRADAQASEASTLSDAVTDDGRRLVPGTVVATYSEALGAWSAAMVVHVNEGRPYSDTVSVLELAWQGEDEPRLREVASAAPLRLTHHSHAGRLSYCNHAAELPRNYVVLGRTKPPQLDVSNSFTPRWRVGQQLAMQLRWDSGSRGDDPRTVKCTANEFDAISEPRPDVWRLTIDDIVALDCRAVVEKFPHLSELALRGKFGSLSHAGAISELYGLKLLSISELFGMTADDYLPVRNGTLLEALYLHNVPAEYAAATRKAWRAERANGTTLEIIGARKPEWVSENRDNPLREWDVRPHISKARYGKSLAHYKETRRAVLAEINASGGSPDERVLEQLGRDYGEAFNRLDGNRSQFIETEEREDLFAALNQIVRDAPALSESEADRVLQALTAGVEEVRHW